MKTNKESELKNVLSEKISEANEILVVPHVSPDFDALGSSVGIVNICKKLGKKSYILVNDKMTEMSASVCEMINEIKDQYDVINVEEYLSKISKQNNMNLMIATDVNKDYLMAIRDYLSNFKTKIVIDHHEEDENTIRANYKYINPKESSASEIVTKLLCGFKVNYDINCANYLLAGIILDTNNFKKINSENSSETMNTVSKLVKRGANIAYVDNLFKESFENDRKIQELINHTIFCRSSYAIACSDENIIYTKEDLAKAADYILKYKTDASFAIGHLSDDVIGISGRSNGNINIGRVLGLLGGGGNIMSGATQIKDSNLLEVKERLRYVLTPGNIDIQQILNSITPFLKDNENKTEIVKALRFSLSNIPKK